MEGGGRGGQFIIIKGKANQDEINILNIQETLINQTKINMAKPILIKINMVKPILTKETEIRMIKINIPIIQEAQINQTKKVKYILAKEIEILMIKINYLTKKKIILINQTVIVVTKVNFLTALKEIHANKTDTLINFHTIKIKNLQIKNLINQRTEAYQMIILIIKTDIQMVMDPITMIPIQGSNQMVLTATMKSIIYQMNI